MANTQTMRPLPQPASSARALAESQEARGRLAASHGRGEQCLEIIPDHHLTVTPGTSHGPRLEEPAENCPQHNVRLLFDRAETGWEHYLCPVYRCTSKLVVLVLTG